MPTACSVYLPSPVLVLRWLWRRQKGYVPLPMSSNPTRIRENFQVFDFSLDAVAMAELDALDEHYPASSAATAFGQLEPY